MTEPNVDSGDAEACSWSPRNSDVSAGASASVHGASETWSWHSWSAWNSKGSDMWSRDTSNENENDKWSRNSIERKGKKTFGHPLS